MKDQDDSCNVSSLMQSIAWQDTLLQYYRSFSLTVEMAMIAALASFILAFKNSDQLNILVAGFLLFVFRTILYKLFTRIISYRTRDVDHWQKLLLEHERTLPQEEWRLNEFKAMQRGIDNNRKIEDVGIDELLFHGPTHTRRIFTVYIPTVLHVVWIAAILAAWQFSSNSPTAPSVAPGQTAVGEFAPSSARR